MTKKPSPKKKPGSQADGVRGTLWYFEPHELTIIGIDTKDSVDHPLFHGASNAYNAEADEAKIANVRTFGVRTPIMFVRDGDRNIVVGGRKRVRWARAAAKLQKAAGEELVRIPAVVQRATEDHLLFGLTRVENVRGPEDSPVEQARHVQRFLAMGRNEREAAVAFAVTPQTITKWLALLSLHPKVKDAVERGMSVDAATRLSKLPSDQQVAKLAEIQATGEKPTARAVTNKLREGSGKPAVETPAQRIKRALAKIAELDIDDGDVHAALYEIRVILEPPRAPNGAAQPAEQEAEFGG